MCYKGAMDRATWRILLTCLLLIALPIKGFAATSMLACGPNHHHLYGTAAHEGEVASSLSHDHGNGETHQHSAMQPLASDPAQSGVLSDDAASAGRSPPLNANFKCNTCAPCCASAMLTNDVSIQLAAPVGSSEFPTFKIIYRSATVGRLDRPPRPILA